jgi:hypothetical protein
MKGLVKSGQSPVAAQGKLTTPELMSIGAVTRMICLPALKVVNWQVETPEALLTPQALVMV